MTLAREPRLQPELYFLEGYYTAPLPLDIAAWQRRLAADLGHVEAIGKCDTPMFARTTTAATTPTKRVRRP